MIVQEVYRSHKKISKEEPVTRKSLIAVRSDISGLKMVQDISNLNTALDNLLDIPVISLPLPKVLKKKESLNISIARKLTSLRKRNKLIKDKKSAHFLFILVFTFFLCWVRLIF